MHVAGRRIVEFREAPDERVTDGSAAAARLLGELFDLEIDGEVSACCPAGAQPEERSGGGARRGPGAGPDTATLRHLIPLSLMLLLLYTAGN